MCLSLPTGSLVLESHIRWERLALLSRMTLDSWVGVTESAVRSGDMRTSYHASMVPR